MQVRASAGQSAFEVCLSHLDDDGILPTGIYRTYLLVTYFLGARGLSTCSWACGGYSGPHQRPLLHEDR